MGREVNRVPLGFVFPLGEAYREHAFEQHRMTCDSKDEDHEECGDDFWLPPQGEGWQLWQTVSDGPITPVFDTAEKLIAWMCRPPETDFDKRFPSGSGWSRKSAEHLVLHAGSAPSFVISSASMQNGADFIAEQAGKK